MIFSERVEWLGSNHSNASGKSNKFYEVVVETDTQGRFLEQRRWGKYGTRGQTSEIVHWNERQALASARAQIRAKLSKGYTRPVDALTRLAHQLED